MVCPREGVSGKAKHLTPTLGKSYQKMSNPACLPDTSPVEQATDWCIIAWLSNAWSGNATKHNTANTTYYPLICIKAG